MLNLLAALTAQLVSRICGSYKTTLAGLIGATATYLGAFTGVVSPKYAPLVTGGGIFLAAVAAALGHDSQIAPVSNGNGSLATPGLRTPFSRLPEQRKLAGIALALLVLIGTLPATGCSGAEVAQDIVNFTPALQSAVTTVSSTASLLLPADAVIFGVATAAFEAGSNLVVAEAKAYLANPSATVLAQLQNAVVTLQNSVNGALLAAAKITNPTSQQHAVAAIGGVATIVTAILALVQKISTPAQVQSMAAATAVKVAQIEPYLPRGQVEMVARNFHVSPDEFFAEQTAAGF